MAGEGQISLATHSLWRYKITMSTNNSAIKSKKGRPAIDSEAVNVRLERGLLVKIDDFRRGEADLPTRPETIRRLVEKALAESR